MQNRKGITFLTVFVVFAVAVINSQVRAGDWLDQYNVIWDSYSNEAKDSMPTGNGDIGINLWVEEGGDLLFYVSKTDSWSDNGRLLKLGRVRVKLSPNPFGKGAGFEQVLKLRQSEIVIKAGGVRVRVWVDANNPVIRVEAEGQKKFEMQVNFETWRETGYKLRYTTISDLYNIFAGETYNDQEGNPYPTVVVPDVIVPGEKDRVVWYHHNVKSGWPLQMKVQSLGSFMEKTVDPLLHRTFGGAIKGEGLVSVNDRVLKSAEAKKKQGFSVYVLTEHPVSVAKWQKDLDEVIGRVDKIKIEKARKKHLKWWDEFWNRSWVRISGSKDAQTVAKSYALFRYTLGCAGRGAQPIKFNGSIFTWEHDGDPDWRQWGPGYWWQNQRLFYWPMMVSGDYDLMQSFIEMYTSILPLVKERAKIYYGHEGANMFECQYFWGSTYNDDYGWDREGREPAWIADSYTKYYWSSSLELLSIFLKYYAHTQDKEFMKEKLMPTADAILTFYDLHYERDENGKMRFEPAASLETWHWAINPLPEIAGLKFLLGKMLDLPKKYTTAKQRKKWKRMLGELPAIPMREVDGKKILSPAYEYRNKANIENPELYAVFPYRIYGMGKPDLELARLTFEHRLHREGNHGHDFDDAFAAYLGLTDKVKEFITRRMGPRYLVARFPTFWHGGYDWPPDQCHGGNGMIALHAMLMQCEDKKILLFPAWPKDWDVEFKLRAPYNTTIEGSYRDGKRRNLKVTPKSRAKDIVELEPQ